MTLSHRCPPQVLHCALAVVEKFNSGRIPKGTPTFKPNAQGVVQIHDVPSDTKEAEIIATITASALPAREVLILVPQVTVSKLIRRELRRRRIAYEFAGAVDVGGFEVFPTLKIWLSNPLDSLIYREVIQHILEGPKIGIPSARSRKIEKLNAREEALNAVSRLWAEVLANGEPLINALNARTSLKLFADIKTFTDALRINYETGVAEFVAGVSRILKPWKDSEGLIEEIVTLVDEIRGRKIAADASVKIMSMRKAKGL